MAHMIEYVIDVDRVVELDFLTGDDEYKSAWVDSRRERWGLLAFNTSTAIGAALAVRHIGAAAVKRLFGLSRLTGARA